MVTLMGGGWAMADPTSPLWIDDEEGNLGTVDLSTGSVTIIGNTGLGSNLADIAFTSNGTLYGITDDALYSISTTTAQPTLVGDVSAGGGELYGLVGDGNDLLAASRASPDLFEISLSPFSVTDLTNSSSTAGYCAGDLAFSADGGSVYESLISGDLQDNVISSGTVTSTIIGPLETAGGSPNGQVLGLATGDDGVTYGVYDQEVYTVDTSTGSLTPLLSYSGSNLGYAFGTAFITEATPGGAVPEPDTVWLFCGGLVLLAGYRWLRSRAARS
jgi:hypothetical protein